MLESDVRNPRTRNYRAENCRERISGTWITDRSLKETNQKLSESDYDKGDTLEIDEICSSHPIENVQEYNVREQKDYLSSLEGTPQY